jgi:2,3-dihydroxybiphenyl 1,2-dioxygenase
MASVSQLGYIGIGASDVKAWHNLATYVLGMQVIPGDEKSTSYLRMDEYHHRVELRPTGNDDLEFAGWEVPDQTTLHRVAQQLEHGGVKVTAGTRDEADGRRVIDLIHCVDPSDVRTEIFCGRPIDPKPFHAGRPISGFKTGEMGLGHMVLCTPSLNESLRFYRDLLGFRVTDFTEVRFPGGDLRLAFLHCNPRHHSVAFMEAKSAPKRINHFMLECNSLLDVGIGRDLCTQRGVPIGIDLGCHMNDRMVSFYLANPSGFAVEYGCGGRTIDDSVWQVEHYDSVESIWGHPQLKQMVANMAAVAAGSGK